MWNIIKYTILAIAILLFIALVINVWTISGSYSYFFGYFQKHFGVNEWLIRIITIIFVFIFIFYILPNISKILNPLKPLSKKQFPSFIIMIFLIVLWFITYLADKDRNFDYNGNAQTCRAWAIDHYEKVPCNWKTHPKYGTKVFPVTADNAIIIDAFRKIKINKQTVCFNPIDGTPVVYYYMKSDSTYDFFNSVGYHPLYGEQLKPVTNYIIENYFNNIKRETSPYTNTEKYKESLEEQYNK